MWNLFGSFTEPLNFISAPQIQRSDADNVRLTNVCIIIIIMTMNIAGTFGNF